MSGRVAAVLVAVALVAAAPAGAAKPKAPQISGVTIDGQWLDLRSFRGRPIFVNVWAAT